MKRAGLPKDLGGKTRFAILDRIARSGAATASEIADDLRLSYPGAKAQCAALTDAGYLEAVKRRSPRGRPENVYAISEKGRGLLPDTGSGFAAAVLGDANVLCGPQTAAKLLFRYFQAAGERYRAELEPVAPSLRPAKLAARRSAEGHFARVEYGDAPALVEGHNPLWKILKEFPEAADYETAALARALGVALRREESRHGETHFHWPPGSSLQRPPPESRPRRKSAERDPGGPTLGLLFD